ARPEDIFFWRSSRFAMTGLKAKRHRIQATTAKLSICARMPGRLMPNSCVIWVTGLAASAARGRSEEIMAEEKGARGRHRPRAGNGLLAQEQRVERDGF